MIIGVMSRAGLGHIGGALIAARAMPGAALMRVFGPMLFANAGQFWLSLSASLWCLAFALFVIVFAPILCRSRIDGKPG